MSIFKKTTIFDWLAIFLLVFLAIFISFFVRNFSTSNNEFVEIYKDNTLVYKDSLIKENIIDLKTIVVEIKNKKVHVKYSNCPHQICVHTGWIDKPYQQIVCVPNKVLIEIKVSKQQKNFDAVTY